MKTIQEQIAVMQAFAEGKQIQISTKPAQVWTDIPKPKFNWECCDHRIKPREPRRIWIREWIPHQAFPGCAWRKINGLATKQQWSNSSKSSRITNEAS